MTAPIAPPPRLAAPPTGWSARYLTPRVLLPAMAVALMVTILFTALPSSDTFQRSPPLRTTDHGPGGASGFYETAQRLGWPVSRRDSAYTGALDTTRVYAVLAPVREVPAAQVHRLLTAVRAGAGLLVILNGGEPLADSLRLAPSFGSTMVRTSDTLGCPRTDVGDPAAMWPFSQPSLYGLKAVRGWPVDTTVFASVLPVDTTASGRRVRRRADSAHMTGAPEPPHIDTLTPSVVGFPLGAGRVVVMSDADLVRNDVIRVCKFGIGVASLRSLDWVSRGGRPALEFDEYHQTVPESTNIVWRYLTTTDSGHVVLQAICAALLLMIAVGVRAVPPVAPRRIERRSALEYVEALARAYAQARASRVAVRRLLRGLRRRHARSLARNVPDDLFLETLAARNPALAPDTRVLRDAADRTLTPTELLAVGQAVAHIDRTLHP
jgi:hypothetical protein